MRDKLNSVTRYTKYVHFASANPHWSNILHIGTSDIIPVIYIIQIMLQNTNNTFNHINVKTLTCNNMYFEK